MSVAVIPAHRAEHDDCHVDEGGGLGEEKFQFSRRSRRIIA